MRITMRSSKSPILKRIHSISFDVLKYADPSFPKTKMSCLSFVPKKLDGKTSDDHLKLVRSLQL